MTIRRRRGRRWLVGIANREGPTRLPWVAALLCGSSGLVILYVTGDARVIWFDELPFFIRMTSLFRERILPTGVFLAAALSAAAAHQLGAPRALSGLQRWILLFAHAGIAMVYSLMIALALVTSWTPVYPDRPHLERKLEVPLPSDGWFVGFPPDGGEEEIVLSFETVADGPPRARIEGDLIVGTRAGIVEALEATIRRRGRIPSDVLVRLDPAADVAFEDVVLGLDAVRQVGARFWFPEAAVPSVLDFGVPAALGEITSRAGPDAENMRRRHAAVLAVVVNALESDEWETRLEAASALGQLGAPAASSARGALTTLAADESEREEVRAAAREAIRAIDGGR